MNDWQKNKLLSTLLISVHAALSLNARAVSVNQCPDSINISYEKLEPLDNRDLSKTPGTRMIPPPEYDLEKVIQARDALAGAPAQAFQNVVYHLHATNNAQCDYFSESSPRDQGRETRLFTRKGRDILRVALAISPETVVWIYHSVESYNRQGIRFATTKRTSRILGVFDHGSPIYYIGTATLAATPRATVIGCEPAPNVRSRLKGVEVYLDDEGYALAVFKIARPVQQEPARRVVESRKDGTTHFISNSFRLSLNFDAAPNRDGFRNATLTSKDEGKTYPLLCKE